MHIPNDAVALQIEHGMVVAETWSTQRRTGSFALLLARLVPWRRPDRESLRAADYPVESVEFGTIDHGVLMPQEHLATVFERIHYHGARIAQLDLEHRVAVLSPPSFADTGVVVAEFEEVAEYRHRAGDLGQVLDIWDVSGES